MSAQGRVQPNREAIPPIRHKDLLLVSNTPKGRGVFAKERLAAGTIIEVSPVLVLSPSDAATVKSTAVKHYSYNWRYRDSSTQEETQTQAIALGLGSIFNHSKHQNAGFRRDFGGACIIYSTLRDVDAGEELCISYGPRLWFEDAEENSDSETDNPLDDIARIDV